MHVIEIVLIVIGLSLDVFAYALYKGAMLSKIDKGNVAKCCLIFSVWQVGGLLLGNLITLIPFFTASHEAAKHLWRICAAVIFLAIGLYMIIKGAKKEEIIERKENQFRFGQLAVWACITSIDAVFAGIGFAFLDTQLLVTAFVTALTTIAVVIVGILCGYRLGCGVKNRAIAVGGCILLVAAFDIAIRYISI
ncbi:MAG TPA: manganese efflux pump [Lachnospiraceae bacterium]|nr:manganese efflux pump [Lachnospiraceae bacterium]